MGEVSNRYLRAREARGKLHEELIAERRKQREYSQSPAQVIDRASLGTAVGGVLGAGGGFLLGGPAGILPGAAKGAAYGGAAGLAGGVAEYGSGDPIVGDVVETVSDPLLALGPRAVRAARHVPGGSYSRARRSLEDLGLSEEPIRGTLGPATVDEIAQAGYQSARGKTTAAYEAWRESTTGAVLTPGEVKSALEGAWEEATLGVGRMPVEVKLAGRREIPYDAQSLDVLRQDFVSLKRQAAIGNDLVLERRVGKVLNKFDELENELARRAPGGVESLAKLRGAREARRAQGFIESGERGFDKTVFQQILGPQAPNDPAVAVRNIIVARRPEEAVRQLRAVAENVGRRNELDQALKGGYLDLVFSRNLEAVGGAVRKGPALHNQVLKTRRAGETILGKSAYDRFEALVAAVSRDEGGKSVRVSLPMARDLLHWTSQGGAVGAVVGGITGGAGFGSTGATTGMLAGGLAGTVFASILENFGPKTARRVALESFTDPDLLRKITKKAGEQEGIALAERLVESLARRGVITAAGMLEVGTRRPDTDNLTAAEEAYLAAPQIME